MNKPQSELPAFPRPVPRIPDLPPEEKADWVICEPHRRMRRETLLLPFWQGMGPVYAAILADNGSDGLALACTIEDWPESFDAQQHALVRLIDESKLRLAWRSLAQQMPHFTDGQQTVSAALEKELSDSACPMHEIPFYSQALRISCQQVICMPVSQWDAMFSQSACYEPASVDRVVVKKLATRIARVLNAPFDPPYKPPEYGNDPDHPWAGRFSGTPEHTAPEQPVVCEANPRSLTTEHCIEDRLFDEYLRPIEHKPDQIPSWRFDGFYGQLRVTGIGDEPWYVTVLAPAHFVACLRDVMMDLER